MENRFDIKPAKTKDNYKKAKELFHAYLEHLRLDHEFNDVDEDYKSIQKQYQSPHGILLIIWDKEKAIGCGGLRKFDENAAEIKRMYIHFEYQGLGLGKQLLHELIQEAKKMRYQRILLDTLPAMNTAIHLYEEFGFKETRRYNENPHPDARFFKLDL